MAHSINCYLLGEMIRSIGRSECLEPDGTLMLPDKVGFAQELVKVCGSNFNFAMWEGKTIIYEGKEFRVSHLIFIKENMPGLPFMVEANFEEPTVSTVVVTVKSETIPRNCTMYKHSCRNMSPLDENNE
jgi:hypothetical protein